MTATASPSARDPALEALLGDLERAGIELWVEGEQLRFRAPQGALTPELRAGITSRKAAILEHLKARAAALVVDYPLSHSQQSLWFLHHQMGHSAAYHIGLSARILGTIDVAALKRALQAIVDRHASLRTTYVVNSDGTPVQRVSGRVPVTLDLHAIDGKLDDEALRGAVFTDFSRPFDLETGPLFRGSLFSRGPEDHVLLLNVHHIAADGWSISILFEEVIKLYGEATGGPPANLPRAVLQYSDYVKWQEELLAGPQGERLWKAWETALAPPLALLEVPGDRPRPATPTYGGGNIPLDFDEATTKRLKTLAKSEGATPFVVLFGAFEALLFRLTGADDITVGTPTLGRSKNEFMRVIGDFANPVALRARPRAKSTFREFLGELRTTVHEALDAQDLPISVLVRRLQPERVVGRSPLFDAFFAYQVLDQSAALQVMLVGKAHEVVDAGGLKLGSFPFSQREGRFDLALEVTEYDGRLVAAFLYATDLFDEATVRGFADGYRAIVDAILADPAVLLEALPGAPASRAGGPSPEIVALLGRLDAADIRLAVDAGKLKVNAPKGALTDELKAAIGANKEALLVALASAPAAKANADALIPIPRTGSLPVSSVQRRLWFLDRMQPGLSQYNVGVPVRLKGRLDAALLGRAIDALAERHESLRTRFVERDGFPEVEILEPASIPLEIVDVPAGADRERAALRLAVDRIKVPFDLGRGRLVGARLVRLGPEDHILTLAMHHAFADGWAISVAIREVCELYTALAAGLSKPPPLALQYVDYAAWEKRRLESGRMAKHLAFWKKELAGAPEVLELPTDRPRPPTPSLRGQRMLRRFDPSLRDGLKGVARQHEATLYMVLLAGWQVLLHRYSGQEEIVVGSPVANREHPALEGIIGCFVNNVVVRGNLHDNPRFADFLRQIKEKSLSAFEHGELPFDVLVNALGQTRSTDHAPVFQVMFGLQSFPFNPPAPPGLTITAIDDVELDGARFDLALEVAEYDGKFAVSYELASDLFDEDTISRMHGHFARLLAEIVKDPAARVKDLVLRTAEDESLLLGTLNDTALEHDRARCVHQLLEATARATPDAVAAISGDERITYRELDERANRLAQLLVARGVRPGSLVAVCVDRTLDMPVALAAVHKAGAAYVPLDPTHPSDRLRYTLDDAGVACAITLARFATLLGEGDASAKPIPKVCLDEVAAALEAQPKTPPEVKVAPADRAYVIYTSGSTGRPKGVEVEHRNVVAFLESMRRAPGLTAADTLLAVTTLSFDIAGLEMWLPLMVGAKIVIASKTDVIDGERLMALMTEHAVSVMQATPATWRLLLDAGWNGKRDLKVLCGGEAMPRDLALALTERVGELWNMYGPTETTIWSTVSRITDGAAPITIGRPIHNTTIYILESTGQLAPVGVPGELCIGGEGVARGYHDRPELTAEKFTVARLPNGHDERVYRTGDLARMRADGRIDFLGRRDHQVKVRGYRIELGEIEAVLATHAGVKECVVAVREDTPGDQRLVGYVVLTSAFDAEAARTTLREKLPDYMVPNQFMTLAALPLTPNGKLDRKALPRPDAPAHARSAADDAAESLMSPPQRRVASVWRDVLHIDRVGLHDNFFDVGGHSLLLVKLHASLKKEFDTDMKLVELFQWTTIAGQAARLSAASTAGDAALKRAQARAAKQSGS